MKEDVLVTTNLIIPAHEIEITTSRSSGPGGQHVNKSNTRVSLRWNVIQSRALSEPQRERLLDKLKAELTQDGDIIVHSGSSRSLHQNLHAARDQLAKKLLKALKVPKKRIATEISFEKKEALLRKKRQRSEVKKMRRKIEWD